jgi:opacity protein-like surface antigen
VYVRDRSGRLVVELRKQAVESVTLGLPAGRYDVYLERDRRGYEATATLRDGLATRLANAQFAIAEVDPAIARGGERAPANTLAGEPMFRRPHRFPAYVGVGFGQTRIGQDDGLFVSRFEAAALLFGRRLALGVTSSAGLSGALTDAPTSVSFNSVAAVARYSFFCERHAYCLGAGIASGIVGVEREDREMPGQTSEAKLFLLEPSLTWYINVTSFLRLGVDLGYRYVRGGDRDIAPSDVRGLTTSFTTQIGWF